MSQWPRQQAGIACEECRKRKLRCDRQEPRCGACRNAGIKCEVNRERLQRGPRKGSLKLLRNRIIALEERLPEAMLANDRSTEDMSIDLTTETLNGDSNRESRAILSPISNAAETPSTRLSKLPLNSQATFLNELMRAELDQLYFDRVHAIVPIINKYRYLSWARDSTPEDHRICLQNAMWTLAMSLSYQFENVRERLYTETRQMLAEQDTGENEMNVVHLEQVQARILITFYEFLRCSYRQAWFSAGRAFRLIQLLRLHEIDGPVTNFSQLSLETSDDNIIAEEKRRAFWVAYCLDRFISANNGLPLTLNEEVICTRLPCLEPEFAIGKSTQVCFLSEAIVSNDYSFFSPLAECVIFVTLYGRALSHHHVSNVEQVYGNASQDFWFRHDWIDTKLTQKIQIFSLSCPSVSLFTEPMHLLTYMVLQTTILYLFKIMEPLAAEEHSKDLVISYRNRAMSAAREIARLAKMHAHIGYFRGHVFMPVAIFIGAERLLIQRDAPTSDLYLDGAEAISVQSELDGCLETLRIIQPVNNQAGFYLNLLESGDFSESRPLRS